MSHSVSNATPQHLWTIGKIAEVTGLARQTIHARVQAGTFIDAVSRDEHGVRWFDPTEVMKFYLDEATAEMVDFLNIILRSDYTAPNDAVNAEEVKRGLLSGTISILDVVRDLNQVSA